MFKQTLPPIPAYDWRVIAANCGHGSGNVCQLLRRELHALDLQEAVQDINELLVKVH